ncbi:MAG: hypothetical protein ABSA05_09330 [Opitutaceae bacterium]
MKSRSLSVKSKRRSNLPALGIVPTSKVFKSGNSSAMRAPAGLARRREGLAALFGSAPDFPVREC